MDHHRPTCRYLYVGLLGAHGILDHLDGANVMSKGHPQIRPRMTMIPHIRFYGGVVLFRQWYSRDE
jgi:aspartyl aminopeptidase